jgi:hypothetical protein
MKNQKKKKHILWVIWDNLGTNQMILMANFRLSIYLLILFKKYNFDLESFTELKLLK